MNIKRRIAQNLINVPGWRTNRKIIVFESDDWGAIRMASKSAFNNLLEKGYGVENNIYNSNDMLENNDDLERLFEVLNLFRDINGNPPIITINNIVTNPDFKKIKANNFQKYFFEPFTETLNKYPNHDRVIALYKEGINNNFIRPQFHGREHVHVFHWLASLQSGDLITHEAFNNNMFTLNKEKKDNCRSVFLDAMGTYDPTQVENAALAIKEGLEIFEKIWGFRSKTIIPPCYVWHPDIEIFFKREGIKIIQSNPAQIIPQEGSDKYKIKRRYTGQKNKLGLCYTIRNVVFEPSENQNFDWVSTCMKEINNSFFWKKPAIISTHRVNYMSGLNMNNADKSLLKLKELIQRIIQRWPEAEFMSSDRLGDVILS